MSKSGYIVQIKNEYFFLNNITQDASKAYSYKLEELADTDWVKRYDPKYDNPEETIEIVHNMKWFVRSKKAVSNGKYLYLENSISTLFAPEYHQLYVEYAQQFDTKEEAEKWTNPLTEAVQLPMDGDND